MLSDIFKFGAAYLAFVTSVAAAFLVPASACLDALAL